MVMNTQRLGSTRTTLLFFVVVTIIIMIQHDQSLYQHHHSKTIHNNNSSRKSLPLFCHAFNTFNNNNIITSFRPTIYSPRAMYYPPLALSLSTTSSLSSSSSSSRNKNTIRKRQKENESKLQSLSKSPSKTNEAIQFYYTIWETYIQNFQQEKENNNTNKDKDTGSIVLIPPTVRLMNYAIDACAKAKPYPFTKEAFDIFTTSTSTNTTKTKKSFFLIPNVYTFGSLIRAYARQGDIKTCLQILKEMKENYNVIPNSVIYSTIISTCDHVRIDKNNESDDESDDGNGKMRGVVDVKLALKLFQEAIESSSSKSKSYKNNRVNGKTEINMNIVVYNTLLSVLAKAGEWKLACQILDEMEGFDCVTQGSNDEMSHSNNNLSSSTKRIVPLDVIIPPPDHVTYGTVMAACERAKQWKMVLKVAERVNKHKENRNQSLDGMSLSSALKACQQLGLADEALGYLNQMKKLKSDQDYYQYQGNNGHNGQYRRRKPLQGPDDVAYRLAISACARSGYMENYNSASEYNYQDGNDNTYSQTNRWIDGIRLLREMEEVSGSPPDVIAYTAAIGGCAVAGEYKRAIQLLKEMKSKGVEPNVVTFTAVISACASACAKREAENNDYSNTPIDGGENSLDSSNSVFIKTAAIKAALTILDHMTKADAPLDIQPNIVTYNAAIRACAEGLNVAKAFALLDDLKRRDLEPTIVTYGTLMTACERVGDVNGATKVFRLLKDSNLKPNEIVYGAAISCFRKASQSERTFLLLRKMIDENLSPNTATFNTVIVSQTETKNTKNALAVYEMMTSSTSQYNKPNRQTYTMLIQSMAMNAEPSKAEYLLRRMREDGMKPDVDLFTMTVTAYEKNREPRKALALMESMREDGYDFYDIKVLDAAFKQGVKLINTVVKK